MGEDYRNEQSAHWNRNRLALASVSITRGNLLSPLQADAPVLPNGWRT